MYAGKFADFFLLFCICLKILNINEANVYSDARNMARDVHNILLKVVMQKGKMTEMEAQDYIKKMDAQKRYSSDVWS